MGLTAAKVREVSEPGRYGDGKGLALVVAPGGSKSWVARIQKDGRRSDFGLGGFPAVTLGAARATCEAYRVAVREGRSLPKKARKSRGSKVQRLVGRGVPTFEKVARQFHAMNKAAGGWRSEKNSRSWLRRAEMYLFDTIGQMPIDQISVTDIRDGVLIPAATTMPETGKRLRLIAHQTFQYAVESEYTDSNPVDRIPAKRLPKLTPTHLEALPYGQVPDALARLNGYRGSQEAHPWRATLAAFSFLIITAARSGEVRGATWAEIDLDKALWEIPSERMKMSRAHRAPLSVQALTILEDARARWGSDGFVFPHPTTGRGLSVNCLTTRAKQDGLHCVPHGFRSSFSTWAAECSGASFEEIELSLAHSVGNAVSRAYNRSDLLDKRRALMQTWADFVSPLPALPF